MTAASYFKSTSLFFNFACARVPCARSPTWSPIVTPLAVLCGSDSHRPLLLEVCSWSTKGAHTLLCSARASVEDLKDKVGGSIPLTASVSAAGPS